MFPPKSVKCQHTRKTNDTAEGQKPKITYTDQRASECDIERKTDGLKSFFGLFNGTERTKRRRNLRLQRAYSIGFRQNEILAKTLQALCTTGSTLSPRTKREHTTA